MGEAHPTETEAFLSKARLLEGTTTTGITTQSRPISSLITPTSDLGRFAKIQIIKYLALSSQKVLIFQFCGK